MTDTIHGYEIIVQAVSPGGNGTRPGRVILVDRGAGSQQRYVTAWQGRDLMGPGTGWDGEWGWGHYFDDKALAEADFHMRCVRGY